MRTVLVTGGNRGIGLAIVKELLKTKEDMILLGCRDIENGEELAKELGEHVHAVELDLSNKDILSKCLEKLIKDFKNIDVLINNAGMLKKGSFLEADDEDFKETYFVNTLAPYELMKRLIPKMIEKKYGRVVNMSSGYGSFHEGLEGPFSYSFSKAALNALTLSISKDLPSNVKVNSMCPGWVKTRMGGENAPKSPEEAAQTAVWLTNLDESGPSGKFFRDKKEINW